jgi:hypothetical protein
MAPVKRVLASCLACFYQDEWHFEVVGVGCYGCVVQHGRVWRVAPVLPVLTFDWLVLALLQFIANAKAYKDAFALEPPRMKSFGPDYNFAADDNRWMGSWLTKPDDTTKSK